MSADDEDKIGSMTEPILSSSSVKLKFAREDLSWNEDDWKRVI